MNDVPTHEAAAADTIRATVVRPRDAASLILLRGAGGDFEVLVGRRSLSARFMPGVYVFPGGAIDPSDRVAWTLESGAEALPPRLAQAARAAIRETWEEVGVLVGAPAATTPSNGPAANGPAANGPATNGPATNGPASNGPATTPIEAAFRERGVTAALDRLTYVGRAITPSHSFRRFNTRFFLGDGASVFGEPAASDELEDAGWHRIEQGMLDGFRDVTRFMLARAIAIRQGSAEGAPPLFYWAKNARRIGVCREGSL